eukprot:scaffold309014_cov27-Tisochrysis_lutea.AAC.1
MHHLYSHPVCICVPTLFISHLDTPDLEALAVGPAYLHCTYDGALACLQECKQSMCSPWYTGRGLKGQKGGLQDHWADCSFALPATQQHSTNS